MGPLLQSTKDPEVSTVISHILQMGELRCQEVGEL